MTSPIPSPDDLPFVTHDTEGARNDWNPPRELASPEAGMRRGLAFVLHDLAQLARVDEYEAYSAITQALTAATWDRDRAEEAGFVDGLARVALIGLRALAATRPLPFETDFDPQEAQWQSLHARVALMEAQLRAMRVKPWRAPADASSSLRAR